MGDRRRKLRERLARAKECKPRQLDQLYSSYGFERREGAKHVVYTHCRYKMLRATVARQDPLNIGYVRTAERLLAELERLDAERQENTERSVTEESWQKSKT